MTANGGAKSKRAPAIEPEELTARIVRWHQTYFISRTFAREEAFVDDEATIEIKAQIEKMSQRHRKHLGERLSLSLLSAFRYTEKTESGSCYFGSVNLRGSQRSALAYLPRSPFWALPEMLERGADLVELRFEPLHQGFATLTSLYLARDEDFRALEELVRSKVR